jgi:hypothetical protein
MALKSKITKAEFDALNDVLKAEYKVGNSAGDMYVLDTDEATELRAARDRANQERDTAAQERDRLKAEKEAAEAAAQKARDDEARAKGDTAALDGSWQAKLDKQKKDDQAVIAGLQKTIENLTVNSVAKTLANDISTAPELLEDHIAKRLKPEINDGVAITRVLDKDGKPSALSLEELKQEFVANPKFAAIIKGSNASGGGATGGGTGGGAPGTITGKKFNTLTEAERTALHASDPAKFKDLAARAKKGEDVTV